MSTLSRLCQKTGWFARIVALTLLASSCGRSASAGSRELKDFHHTAWTSENGIGGVFDVQQGPDGYLWLTTARGIFRFDGVRFQPIDEVTNGAAHNSDLDSVSLSAFGGAWLVTRSQGLLLWKDGQLKVFPDRRCTPGRRSENIAEDKDGSLWILASAGLFHLRQGVCEQIGPERGYPGGFASAFLMDRKGTLWVKMPSGVLLFLPRGEAHFKTSPYGAGLVADFTHMHEAPDGSVWLSDDVGLRRIAGAKRDNVALTKQKTGSIRHSHFGNFTFSADGSLWASTHQGIERFGHPENFPIDAGIDSDRGQSFMLKQDLSSDVVWKLMSDVEGTLWVATNAGLDQLRRNPFMKLPLPALPAYQLAIAPGDQGTVWIGNRGMPLTQATADGQIKPFPKTRHTVSIRRDHHGTIWSAGLGEANLWQTTGTESLPVHYPNEKIEIAASTAVDRNNDPWISTFAPNMYHRIGNVWTNENNTLGRKPGVIGTMREDEIGNIWFAFSNKLVKWDGKAYQRYSFPEGTLNISVATLATRGDHVWFGGAGGIVLFRNGRFERMRWQNEELVGKVSGLLETETGELWVNGFSGVTHIASGELTHWLQDPTYPVLAERFDALDGIPGLSGERFPEPSLVRSSEGRLWFATTKGVAYIDPGTLERNRNRIPPPIEIGSVITGGKTYPGTNGLRLPAHTENLTFQYTALSLAVPERVYFRYKLDGIDKTWQEAGTRRQAFYNSLPPGKYRFHVIACNNDGVWNTTGASLDLALAPAVYQTTWFYFFCALIVLGLLYLAYLFRVRQITSLVQRRMDDRADERIRIARELHDTLLQTLHGLMLRFHFAVEALPEEEPARANLELSLARADDAILETRQKVQELRSAVNRSGDFRQILMRTADDLRLSSSCRFTVIENGALRTFSPLVQDELCHLAQEAIRNSFNHAEASQIEVELAYGRFSFQMTCRDNGKGIDADILRKGGREGHWGLVGMKERAKVIGGTFNVWSSTGNGTEITVHIPAVWAYADARFQALWSRLFPR